MFAAAVPLRTVHHAAVGKAGAQPHAVAAGMDLDDAAVFADEVEAGFFHSGDRRRRKMRSSEGAGKKPDPPVKGLRSSISIHSQ